MTCVISTETEGRLAEISLVGQAFLPVHSSLLVVRSGQAGMSVLLRDSVELDKPAQ